MSVHGIDGTGGPRRTDGPDNRQPRSREVERSDDDSRRGDRVEVSDRAREAARLARKASSLPEVREEKIDTLRRAVADDTYRPSPERLARAILEFEDGLDR